MNVVYSKAVRIEIEYEDGCIERAEGDDANEIVKSMGDAFAFRQNHGITYRGPQMRLVAGAEKHHEASKS